ncbi:MAG: hypothetical protein IJ695_01845 [Butyrivibrio sp.]|nr:hypothetical protein [Butyrivibrio sp.]
MEIREFGEMMVREVKSALGKGHLVECRDIVKNNGVVYHAIVIRREDESVAPTIYLDQMFDRYLEGCSVVSLAGDIVEIYRQSMPGNEIDIEAFTDFSRASENLFFKVVNYRKNKSKLEKVPYRKVLDLAMVPLCLVKSSSLGIGTITIEKSHLDVWEITEDELWEVIGENAAKVCPPKTEAMVDVLENITHTPVESDEMGSIFVISNDSGNLGAGAAFYPGVMRQMSDAFECDLFLIPSSIHEMLIIPDPGAVVEPDALKQIIREVNSSTVAEEEILSYNLYRYDRETDHIFIVKEAS